jgi:hypothetical protein
MASPIRSRRSSRDCPPKYQTPRSPNRATRGHLVAKMAEAVGQPLMPWQRLVADVALELRADGTPAYREVIVTVPRQSGKTTLLLASWLQLCLLNGPAKCAYTAQTGQDARKKLLDDQVPLIEASPLASAVRRVGRAQGNECVVFRNGSRIDVLASGPSAGHGKTLDLGFVDEAFDDVDDRREGSMLPAMVTRQGAQLWVVSTQGTDESLYFNRKTDLGRIAALEGRTSGIAFFEWSVPEDADLDDPASWYLGMPALGHTITEDAVAHAKATMSPGEFRRAFGNLRMRNSERIIPESTWTVVQEPDHQARRDRELVLAVEVAPDRDWAAIVAGNWHDGERGRHPLVEVVDYRPGAGWVVDRLCELGAKYSPRLVLDERSPAGGLLPQLRQAGLKVETPTATEVTQASGDLYDSIADGRMYVCSDPRFDTAIEAAAKQVVADAWRFGRKSGKDVCPLLGAVLAASAVRKPRKSGDFFAY